MAHSSHSPSPDRLKQPAAPPPRHHVSPPTIWRTKLALRAASVAFCVLILGLSGGIGAFVDNPEHYLLFFTFQMSPAAAVTIAWDIAESICILVLSGHRGIHPGAIVGVDLVLWLAHTVATVYTGWWEFALYGAGDDYQYFDRHPSNADPSSMAKAVLAFGALAVLTHLCLFIVGCYETNVRSKERRSIANGDSV